MTIIYWAAKLVGTFLGGLISPEDLSMFSIVFEVEAVTAMVSGSDSITLTIIPIIKTQKSYIYNIFRMNRKQFLKTMIPSHKKSIYKRLN